RVQPPPACPSVSATSAQAARATPKMTGTPLRPLVRVLGKPTLARRRRHCDRLLPAPRHCHSRPQPAPLPTPSRAVLLPTRSAATQHACRYGSNQLDDALDLVGYLLTARQATVEGDVSPRSWVGGR